MNPFLALEQYLYLGDPLRIVTKDFKTESKSLVFFQVSEFAHYKGSVHGTPHLTSTAEHLKLKQALEVIPVFLLFLALI
jgi:hypothetical protein